MKRCPKCNLLYDDSLGFCLEDGTSLIAAPGAPRMAAPTLVLPNTEAYPPVAQTASPHVTPSLHVASGKELPARNSNYLDPAASSANATVIWIVAAITILMIILRFAILGSVAIAGAPMMAFCLAGLLVAIIRRQLNPRASYLTVLGLGLLVLRGTVTAGISSAIPGLGSSMHFAGAEIRIAYTILEVLDDFAYAVVIVILVAAVFAGRKPASTVTN